jgi:hypothetical protein
MAQRRPSDLPVLAFEANGFPLLEFDRRPIDRDRLAGFALGWNSEFTLLHVYEREQFRLNGYSIFRNSDIRSWRRIAKEELLARAARLHRLRPAIPGGVAISSIGEALSGAGEAFPLITIYRERIKRNVCHVGKFLDANQRSLSIFSITSEAEWESRETYRLKDITLIQFGGAYERLLHKLAKPLPSAASASTQSASHKTRTPSAAGSQ